jgi:hypothetical protein
VGVTRAYNYVVSRDVEVMSSPKLESEVAVWAIVLLEAQEILLAYSDDTTLCNVRYDDSS